MSVRLFFDGPIVSWKFNDSIVYVKARNRYCFRVSLTFESGAQTDYQRGGFLSKADAIKAKKWQSHSYITKHSFLSTILQRNFLDYWLYYYMTDEVKNFAYGTFMAYRNIFIIIF